MAADVLVINHHQAVLQEKGRNKTGKGTGTFVTTTVTSEPITFMLDEGAVAKRAAEMLAQRISEQTQQITATVKASTAKARRVAERAFYAAKPWAWRRFDGGRTGVTPPKVGENRQFNHSGRLANGIRATFRKTTKDYGIDYTANRWNLKDWRSMADMQKAFALWVSHLPILQDASADPAIRRAIRETFADVMRVNKMGTDHKTATQSGRALVDGLRKSNEALNAGGDDQRDDDGGAA